MLLWLHTVSILYGVEPEFALAVARTESGTKTVSYRTGKMGNGTYYGPMGIFHGFIKKWPIDDPYINILVGVKALRGANQMAVLHRYNTSADVAYIKAVMGFRKVLKDSKFFTLLIMKENLNARDDRNGFQPDQGYWVRSGEAGVDRGVPYGEGIHLPAYYARNLRAPAGF